MGAPEELLADSPADFDSSLAYALHAEMRRLIIVSIVGSILLPIGIAVFLDPTRTAFPPQVLRQALGIGLALVGAAFLYGGLIAILFKTVTDAVIVGQATARQR